MQKKRVSERRENLFALPSMRSFIKFERRSLKNSILQQYNMNPDNKYSQRKAI